LKVTINGIAFITFNFNLAVTATARYTLHSPPLEPKNTAKQITVNILMKKLFEELTSFVLRRS
jgi:hypothetical protein